MRILRGDSLLEMQERGVQLTDVPVDRFDFTRRALAQFLAPTEDACDQLANETLRLDRIRGSRGVDDAGGRRGVRGRREGAEKAAVVRRARARQRSSRVDRGGEAGLRFVVAQIARIDEIERVEREPFVQGGVVGDQHRPRLAEPGHDLRGIRQPVFAMLHQEVDVAARHRLRIRRELTLRLDNLRRVYGAAHDSGLPRDPLQFTNQAWPLRRRHVLHHLDRDGNIEGGVLEWQRLARLQLDDRGIVELTGVCANDIEPR